MPDFRCFVVADEIDGERICLPPAESRHLISVNRARAGNPVTAFDGAGGEFACVLARADSRKAILEIRERITRQRPSYSITLAQALPKGKTFDMIVRQATQIGAARVVPLLTERTEVRLDSKRKDQKEEKWHTAAVEAAKQCGNPFIPEITPVQPLAEFIEAPDPYDLKLLAGLVPEARPLRDLLPANLGGTPESPFRMVWLVGPEGDFTPAEVDAALAHGFAAVTLGPNVLRAETAALYALSISAYEVGVCRD